MRRFMAGSDEPLTTNQELGTNHQVVCDPRLFSLYNDVEIICMAGTKAVAKYPDSRVPMIRNLRPTIKDF